MSPETNSVRIYGSKGESKIPPDSEKNSKVFNMWSKDQLLHVDTTDSPSRVICYFHAKTSFDESLYAMYEKGTNQDLLSSAGQSIVSTISSQEGWTIDKDNLYRRSCFKMENIRNIDYQYESEIRTLLKNNKPLEVGVRDWQTALSIISDFLSKGITASVYRDKNSTRLDDNINLYLDPNLNSRVTFSKRTKNELSKIRDKQIDKSLENTLSKLAEHSTEEEFLKALNLKLKKLGDYEVRSIEESDTKESKKPAVAFVLGLLIGALLVSGTSYIWMFPTPSFQPLLLINKIAQLSNVSNLLPPVALVGMLIGAFLLLRKLNYISGDTINIKESLQKFIANDTLRNLSLSTLPTAVGFATGYYVFESIGLTSVQNFVFDLWELDSSLLRQVLGILGIVGIVLGVLVVFIYLIYNVFVRKRKKSNLVHIFSSQILFGGLLGVAFLAIFGGIREISRSAILALRPIVFLTVGGTVTIAWIKYTYCFWADFSISDFSRLPVELFLPYHTWRGKQKLNLDKPEEKAQFELMSGSVNVPIRGETYLPEINLEIKRRHSGSSEQRRDGDVVTESNQRKQTGTPHQRRKDLGGYHPHATSQKGTKQRDRKNQRQSTPKYDQNRKTNHRNRKDDSVPLSEGSTKPQNEETTIDNVLIKPDDSDQFKETYEFQKAGTYYLEFTYRLVWFGNEEKWLRGFPIKIEESDSEKDHSGEKHRNVEDTDSSGMDTTQESNEGQTGGIF